MHITIAAIGKAKAGALHSRLFDEYVKRLPWTVCLKEMEEKKPLPVEQRKQREAELLLGASAEAQRIVALDERGKEMTSAAFARQIGGWEQEGYGKLAFLIGGQDGHAEEIRQAAHLSLSFGRMTWPHMLVRPLLAEQLYRAYTILTHHPYHRE